MKKILFLILILLIASGAGILVWSSSLAPDGSHDYEIVATEEPVDIQSNADTFESDSTSDSVAAPIPTAEPTPEPTAEPVPEGLFPAGINKGKYEQETEIYGTQYMEYNVVVPNNSEENMALIIYLPGDNSNDRVDEIPYQEFAQHVKDIYGDDFKFIMLLPCTRFFEWHDGWIAEVLKGLIDKTVEDYSINPDRIYLTGYSRGAAGAWQMVEDYGDFFGCLVAVSCGSDIHNYEMFKDVPVWGMSGDAYNDSHTYGSVIKYYCERINEIGGNAKYTQVEGHDHDTGYAAYTEEVIEWMLAQ